MSKTEITGPSPISRVIDALNKAVEIDRAAWYALIVNRVPCSVELVRDDIPFVVESSSEASGTYLGLLGVVNGIMTVLGLPRVAAVFEDQPDRLEFVGFQVFQVYVPDIQPTERTAELRAELDRLRAELAAEIADKASMSKALSRCTLERQEVQSDLDKWKRIAENAKYDNRQLAAAAGNYWVWQNDGSDHIESLTCPVLIQPRDLEAILRRAEEAEAAIEACDNAVTSAGRIALGEMNDVLKLRDALEVAQADAAAMLREAVGPSVSQ